MLRAIYMAYGCCYCLYHLMLFRLQGGLMPADTPQHCSVICVIWKQRVQMTVLCDSAAFGWKLEVILQQDHIAATGLLQH